MRFRDTPPPVARRTARAFYAGHKLQFAANKFRVAAKLALREPPTGDREKDAINVAEIVNHHRLPMHGGRQTGLRVIDLAPQLVSDLRDGVLVKPVLNDGADHRSATQGLRFDALELPESLASAFDWIGGLFGNFLGAGARIGGHDQRFLEVNSGSSSRPKRWYATIPPRSTKAIETKRLVGFELRIRRRSCFSPPARCPDREPSCPRAGM